MLKLQILFWFNFSIISNYLIFWILTIVVRDNPVSSFCYSYWKFENKNQGLSLMYNTIPTRNSRTWNSHTYPNSHTLFALTKMWQFGNRKDFGKNRLIFFNSETLNSHFSLFFKIVKCRTEFQARLAFYWCSFSRIYLYLRCENLQLRK